MVAAQPGYRLVRLGQPQQPLEDLAAPPVLAGDVQRDRAQPGRRIDHVEELAWPVQRAGIRLLHRVLCLGVVARRGVDHGDQPAVVRPVRLGHRGCRVFTRHGAPFRH